MTNEEREKQIQEMKKLFTNNEKFTKNGREYYRFVVQKVEVPNELGKQYLQIVYDDDQTPYVVITVNKGITKEEKERRKKEVQERRAAKHKEITRYRDEIKAIKKQIRDNTKNMNFTVCEELKQKLLEKVEEYKQKFGRKK